MNPISVESPSRIQRGARPSREKTNRQNWNRCGEREERRRSEREMRGRLLILLSKDIPPDKHILLYKHALLCQHKILNDICYSKPLVSSSILHLLPSA